MTMIIIPAIDIISGKCVRLSQGDYGKKTVYSDNPVDMALSWQGKGAKYLHLVDLDGAKTGKPVNIEIIREICKKISIPCELGGGIRTFQDVELLFNAGVDRIILGTAAVENPEFIKKILSIYGVEKIIIGIDAKNGRAAVKGWLETSNVTAIELAMQFAEIGIRRFIYTDISKDGALSGPNIEMTCNLCEKIQNCFVIASGGVGSMNDIKKLSEASKQHPNLEGIIVGKALYEKKITLEEIISI